MIELNWDNLRKLFVWASKQNSSDQPYVDDGDDSIMIDGSLDRKIVEGFLAQQRELACDHEWVDVSTYAIDKDKKEECCVTCGDRRTVNR